MTPPISMSWYALLISKVVNDIGCQKFKGTKWHSTPGGPPTFLPEKRRGRECIEHSEMTCVADFNVDPWRYYLLKPTIKVLLYLELGKSVYCIYVTYFKA
jgi:hypothetical protein